MKTLNRVTPSSTPLSVLSERRTRKAPSVSIASPLKLPNSPACIKTRSASQECLSRSLHGGLVLLSSFLSTGFAKALSYEEALEQTTGSPSSFEVDPKGILDSVIGFATENPTVVAGGAVGLAVPLILSQLLKNPKPWGVESARNAYAKLGDDATVQLLDIRPLKEFKEIGSPDIRGLGKKPVSIAYNGEDKPGFLKKLSSKFKEPENTTLFIIDKFDGNSELVAELVTANGFKAAYAVKDGADGPRGWVNSGLPWITPKKGLDLGNLTEAFTEAFGEGSDGISVSVGIAAAAGLGFLAFSELDTILQLLGSVAIVQFVSKKLLYAENRKQTLQQVDEFLNTKLAPKELVDDVKQIGVALLPTTTTSKALSAPTEAKPEPKVEAAAAESRQVNSVPQTKSEADVISGISRPLSPYASYPDLKPPTSPTPSQPATGKTTLSPTGAKPEPKVEAAAVSPLINSVPKTESKADGNSGFPRPLSPYASYPDLKPPTSPTPSQP
ncbi:Thylakoid rhodanese-like, putative isoform 3 [Hibiscus syriacus]|uniref:Thylakoid rhodanese-like, putative isoform 3 n=1 Tax=Hibiscus syriacus TaxID=106335 RepID=A0A6A2WUZ6_HIBSY|nr:rhodanese-like domain-containing protein 4, chloroplastic [Hibiscus syriacus]KAE8664911.1 Thylakoid rhodanese-like, putative isoform 3 [Hibiscus syriacus]